MSEDKIIPLGVNNPDRWWGGIAVKPLSGMQGGHKIAMMRIMAMPTMGGGEWVDFKDIHLNGQRDTLVLTGIRLTADELIFFARELIRVGMELKNYE